MTDLEALSYRARGHLRQLARMRWLAIGIAAALAYFAHTALDVLVPLAPLFITHSADVDRLGKIQSVRAGQFVLDVAERFRALRERIGKGLLSAKESGRGNGSGVLIACAAVERFGGTIHISDRRGGGTRVQVELPLFRPRAATTGEDDDYRRLGIA